MRRGKARLKGAKPLSLAVSSLAPTTPYLTVVSRGEPAVPASVAPVATAAALKEEAVEVAVGGDWPSRPAGVSEEVLYNEWLRVHTPKATVATSKRMADGSYKRKSYNYSNILRPKAIAIGVGVMRHDCYVIPLREYMSRINESATSRYKTGARSPVKELVNPKAEKYILDCHAHRALVWKGVVRGCIAKSQADASQYSFKDRIEMRRLEKQDDPSQYDASGVYWEQAVSDASAAANDESFVGPIAACTVPDKDINTYFVSDPEAELVMWSVREHDYLLRHQQLEQAFAAASVKAPVISSPVEEPRPISSVGKWRSFLENYYLARRKNMLLSADYIREMRALSVDWNDHTGWSHRQMKSRVTQYQYMLRSVAKRNRPVTVSEYHPVSANTFWKMFTSGHSLPGEDFDMNTYFQPNVDAERAMLRARFHSYKLRKAELTETFRNHVKDKVLVKKPDTPADEVLCRLYDRLVADTRKAKAEIKSLVVAAKVHFADMEFVQTESGLLLPAVMLDVQRELAMEPRW